VNAGARSGKVGAYQWRHRRDLVADHLAVIVGDLGYYLGLHAIRSPAQRSVFEHHGLERRVARPLADTEQRAVHRGYAVQPGRAGVHHRTVKVVMAMPFEQLAGEARVVVQAVGDARHRTGQRNPGVGDAKAHRVAGPDLDGNAALFGEDTQLGRQRQHKAIVVGPSHVLKVHARAGASRQGILHHAQELVHRLPAGHVQFLEDVIVGTGSQDPRLLDAHLLHEQEILTFGPNPGRDLRKGVAQVAACIDRLALPLGVNKELALADDAVRAAQFVQVFVQLHDLLDGVRLAGLLPIAESRVRDVQVLRRIHRDVTVVEGDFGHLAVTVEVPVEMGLIDVLQLVTVLLLLERMRALAEL